MIVFLYEIPTHYFYNFLPILAFDHGGVASYCKKEDNTWSEKIHDIYVQMVR